MNWFKRLRVVTSKDETSRELDAELGFHIERQAEEYIAEGMAPEDARRRARREFGGIEGVKEECRSSRGVDWVEHLLQDVRFAARGFRKSPGFALTVIGTLALGLGTLATSFSVFSAVALRPFAVRDPWSLYNIVWRGDADAPGRYSYHASVSWREFAELRRRKPGLADVLAYQTATASVGGKPGYVNVVSGNFFSMLGGRVCMGRPLVEADDAPGVAVAVASDWAWKRRLHEDPKAVGSKVYLHVRPVEIVGVACPEFNGVGLDVVDLWLSRSLSGAGTRDPDAASADDAENLYLIGRLRPGATPDAAKPALLAFARESCATWKNPKKPSIVDLTQHATASTLTAGLVRTFMPVFIAFGLVLLIACANVSNMMLARAVARQREIGVRMSLGAGRARVVRQLLTESALLALPAAIGAYGVAWVTIRAALWLLVVTLPARMMGVPRNLLPDYRVLAFACIVAGLATLVFGLMPALNATRASLVDANRGEFAGGARPSRLRGALVVVQVTASALLLISAAITLRSERKVASTETGIDGRGVFSLTMANKFRPAAVDRLRSLPGVELIGGFLHITGTLPITGGGSRQGVRLDYNGVSPEYFGALRIPLLRGRNFTQAEAIAETPVVVVSETAARRLWGDEDPLGRTVQLSNQWWMSDAGKFPDYNSATVVGVARDVIAQWNDDGPARALLYFPLGAAGKRTSALIVRTKGDPAAARRALESATNEVAPGAADQIVSVEETLSSVAYPFRVLLVVTGFLGALALLLTVSGVYAVLSFLVNQRRRELGIRMALGADARAVAFSVLRQTVRLAGIGVAIGAVLALGVARVIAHQIRPLDPFDLRGYAGGIALVIAAAVAASWIPARRAVRIDPAETLRCE